MLAYTPLHRLLLEAVGRPLVMTSGNQSEEPIAIENQEAKTRLGAIADGFLLHDREIVARYDDSVIRIVEGAPVFLRRARGFAPLPFDMPVESPVPLLAVGSHLKNTFTLVQGRTAYPSQHIGDLENIETLNHFRAALERMQRLFRIEPEVAVRDLHPGYLSSRVAEELGLAQVITVQHHHAHVAAVLAEHGVPGPAIGLAYDGTGLGDDGNVWGAEVMVADLIGYHRLAHLRYAPMPGGDLAARTPWRCLAGYASLSPENTTLQPTGRDPAAEDYRIALRQIERGINAPLASSMGRLFDAAAAVLGVRDVASYEGQAAMELESIADGGRVLPLPFPVVDQGDGWQLDPVPLLSELAARKASGEPVPRLAAAFHESIAEASTDVVGQIRRTTGLDTVVLSGGTFQNARLLRSLRRRLLERSFRVLVPSQFSPNDGAISVGQAAVAAARLAQQH
jgi:hydrogenase maturation protein HypF